MERKRERERDHAEGRREREQERKGEDWEVRSRAKATGLISWLVRRGGCLMQSEQGSQCRGLPAMDHSRAHLQH